MEQILGSLVRELPSLGGLALIVIVFLRHINKADERGQAMLERMAEQCHDAHDRIAEVSQQAIDRGTRAIDRNTQAIERNTERMGEVAGRLGALNGKVVSMLVALTLLAGGRADAQDNRAVSAIGLCHTRYDYAGFISRFRHATAIRTTFLMKTFNPTGCPNGKRLLAEPRPLELDIAVLNGPGERNRRLQPYEYLHGIAPAAAEAQFERGQGPAVDRYRGALTELREFVGAPKPNLKLRVKPCLECNYKPKARQFLLDEAKRTFPEAELIDNPLNGSCIKRAGTLCEKHSNVTGYDIVDLDGTDYDTINALNWARKNAKAVRVSAWKYCDNGFEKGGPWKPPLQRTHFCGPRDNQDLAYWMRPDALKITSPRHTEDVAGCTVYKPRDGARVGFTWKLSDGRNYAAMLAPTQFARFSAIAIVKAGKVVDRGRFRALYRHDPPGRQRSIYDFTKPPSSFVDNVVIRGTLPKRTVCFPLDKPQFRID